VTSASPSGVCSRCGTAHTGGAEYCLDCGRRLPLRTTFFDGVRNRYRPNPAFVALALLILAALGALVAVVVSRGGVERETFVATHLPARTVVQRRPIFGTDTVVPTTAPPVVDTTPPPATASPRATTLRPWSAADGYTVVLASIPRANGRSSAVQVAKQALAKGLPTVGVLDTRDFSSLHPGYFVVFSGYYRSNATASAHVSQAEAAGFPAYARRITR
jgi:hypothetical protein